MKIASRGSLHSTWCAKCQGIRCFSLEVRVKPSHRALEDVALMPCVRENVSLARVHHKFRLHPKCLELVPELVGLRRRTFSVAVPHQNPRCRRDGSCEATG